MIRVQTLCHLFVVSSIFPVPNATDTSNHSGTRLRQTLFHNYYPDVRPVLNPSDPVNVEIRLELLKIQDVNERSQSLRTNVNLLLSWKDQLLTWNTEEYDGIYVTVFPYNKNIWLPDLMVTNALTDAGELGLNKAFITIEYDGRVTIWTQVVLETSCEITTKKYPFDEQLCDITFGKFMSFDELVAIRQKENEIYMEQYVETAEWSIIENYVTLKKFQITEIPSYILNFTDISYNFKLRRRCKGCIIDVIVPVFVLAILNMLTFFLPCESGEKTSFPVSIFLALAVFLTIITGSLPESVDGISYLSFFVSFQFGVSAVALMCSVISLRLFHNTRTKPVPKLGLALVTACKCQRHSSKTSTVKAERTDSPEQDSNSSVNPDWKAVSEAFDRLVFLLIFICEATATVIFIGLILN